MQRILAVSLICLSLAATLLAADLLRQPVTSQRAASSPDATASVGYAFYDQVERLLAGTASDGLSEVVTGNFIDHTGDGSAGRSAEDLSRALISFGAMFPGTHLRVANIQHDGDRLIAQVQPVWSGTGTVARLPFALPPLDAGLEILRVEHGKVRERWATPLPAVEATTYSVTPHILHNRAGLGARLFRIELPPGGELHWTSGDIAIAMVEAGAVEIQTERPDELATPVSERQSYSEGAIADILPQTDLRLRGQSSIATRLLLFTAQRSSAGPTAPFTLGGGTRSKLVWTTGTPLDVDSGWRVELGRFVLAPGVPVRLDDLPGKAVVVASDDVQARVTVNGGWLWQLQPSYYVDPIESPAELQPDDAVQLFQARSAELETGAGGAVWLIVIDTGRDGNLATPKAQPIPGRPNRTGIGI